MNVIANPAAKSRPFPKRKPSPIAAQATGSAETFVRYVVTKAIEQLERKRDAFTIATSKFPGDARLRTVIRATAEPPTSLANTPALAVMGTDFVESLQPISAAAQLFRASRLMLSFDTYAAISIPDLVGLDEGPPAWVAEGQPAPVGELASQATILEPYKLEFIVTVTREMLLGSNAEKLIGDALRTKIAFDLDKALFDALPADAARPAGLRSYNPRLTESTSTSNETAMMQDVAALVGAAESIAGGEGLYLIGRTKRIMSMRQMYKILPAAVTLLPSAASIALPDSVLLGVVPRAVPSAIGLPEVELVDSGALVMDDAPGSSDMMAGGNVRSLFQSDTFGLKVRLPASWGLRHSAGANWVTCVWPSDLGAGGGTGIPDAPTDGTFYGRHDGAWANVVEEAPAIITRSGAAVDAYVRHGATGWTHLDDALTDYAPLASPQFTGNPTAPTLPGGSRDARLATTAFVTDAVSSVSGLPEVPDTPFGAFARVRTAGGVDWADFVTLGVAPLNSPIFTGAPQAPTTLPNDPSPYKIVNLEVLARDIAAATGSYLLLTGGTLTGQLIVPSGGNFNNVSLGFGDVLTGVYRAGATLGFSVGGVAQLQMMGPLVAFFQPVNLGNFAIQSLADPANPTDALNLRTGDTRYLRSGGPIIAPAGTAPTDVGLGVGDASTGFYRAGTSLAIAALGDVHMLFNANRTAQVLWPLSMSGNVISNLADATAADHALSRGAADARYAAAADAALFLRTTGGTMTGPLQLTVLPTLAGDAVPKSYVDNLRAPAAIFDVPGNINVAATGAWIQIGVVRIIVTRGGASLLAVTVALNIQNMNPSIGFADVRIAGALGIGIAAQRRGWIYGESGGPGSGFTTALYIPVPNGGTFDVQVEVRSAGPVTQQPSFTVIGGNAANDLRSQIVVTDLGPA
jgi:hypothetical protein